MKKSMIGKKAPASRISTPSVCSCSGGSSAWCRVAPPVCVVAMSGLSQGVGDSAETTPLTEEEKAVIRALRPAIAALMRAFDEDLRRAQGLSHTEYIVLMFLSEAPDRTMRLSDLAELVQQSASALGRTVRRLEAEGLVSREQSTQDARSFNAVLTDAGLARLEQALPVHIASVRRRLLAQLEGVDLGGLATAFRHIAGTV